MTWSQRYRVPIRNTTIDFNNPFCGSVPMGWSVGKPFLSASKNTAFFQYTKIGCPPSTAGKCEYVVSYDEAWLFASNDIATTNTTPSFRTLPDGQIGLYSHNRTAYPPDNLTIYQWIAEEGDVVEMGQYDPPHLYYLYRTSDGYLGLGTSTNGGLTFTAPLFAQYSQYLPGTKGYMKNPRGPITPRRLRNGRYLLLYFNRGNGGIQSSRNPYWLAAGTYNQSRGTILWSQPEVVLYTTYATTGLEDPIGTKLGYPDLFEFGDDVYMTETDKITARIHKIDASLIAGLLQQGTRAGEPPLTPLLVWESGAPGAQHVIPTPFDGIDVSMGASLTLEAWVTVTPTLSPRPIILCGITQHPHSPLLHFLAPGADAESSALTTLFRHTATQTVVAMTSQNLTLFQEATEGESVSAPESSSHHLVLVVDGLARIATYYVDGVLLDGDTQKGTGFFELAVLFKKHMSSTPQLDNHTSSLHSHRPHPSHQGDLGQCRVGDSVTSLRVYASPPGEQTRGYLRTSEVVASFLQGPK